MFVAMFALIPLARPIFKECNIPWHLFCAAWSLAACSFTMAMIPGVPAIAWINAANGCGVSMTAAPILGIVGSIIAIVVSCIYIKFALKRAQAKGETYEVTVADSEAAVLGGVMGSGSGAVGIIAQNFLEPYLATGCDPAALAKIIATAATIGGALPNSGAMFGMLAAMGLNHGNSYKHIAAISIGAGLCALIVMIVLANLGVA